MQGAFRLSGPPQDHNLWDTISACRIGPADPIFPFEARLARENGWTLDHARRVVGEYRRFCFLAITSPDQATPSDAVDQAWHLHLTYSRDYWDRFCPHILGRPLHHEPTRGGPAEQGRFFDQYARTLRRYEQIFGEAPPTDIWPDAARRLLHDPRARRVHPADALILPRRLLRRMALLFFLLVLILLSIGKVLSYALESL